MTVADSVSPFGGTGTTVSAVAVRSPVPLVANPLLALFLFSMLAAAVYARKASHLADAAIRPVPVNALRT